MPRAIAYPIRQTIIQRHQAGQPLASIAKELQLSYRTVRSLWHRYCAAGENALVPNYDQCGSQQRRFPIAVQSAAETLKHQHPSWGAGLIQLQLRKQFPSQPLPSWRTLQRWWQQAGLQPARRRAPPMHRQRGQQPHEVWELDAKERIRLQDGSWSSVVSLVDEASGALLSARAFPPRQLVAGACQCCAGLDAPGVWRVGLA